MSTPAQPPPSNRVLFPDGLYHGVTDTDLDTDTGTAGVKQEFVRWSEAQQEARGIVPDEPGWKTMRPHPAPEAPDGLPQGWTLVSQCPRPGTAGGTWSMVRRSPDLGGGWVNLIHWPDTALTEFLFASNTLTDLYANLVRATQVMKANDIAEASMAWYRDMLLALYDLNDPDEAAEHMLFTLSGTMRTPPKADTGGISV